MRERDGEQMASPDGRVENLVQKAPKDEKKMSKG